MSELHAHHLHKRLAEVHPLLSLHGRHLRGLRLVQHPDRLARLQRRHIGERTFAYILIRDKSNYEQSIL